MVNLMMPVTNSLSILRMRKEEIPSPPRVVILSALHQEVKRDFWILERSRRQRAS